VLLRLAALTGDERYRVAAEAALAPMERIASEHPTGFAGWLLAWQLASAPIDEVAIVGEPDADDAKALLAEVRSTYRPGLVLAVSATPDASMVPLLHGRGRLDDRATAYVCRGFACQRPVTDPRDLADQLASVSDR
jgi:uncharacterized protein YyaL (SSP411 family)